MSIREFLRIEESFVDTKKFLQCKQIYFFGSKKKFLNCFPNYSEKESQTLSLFEISRKNLTEAVNKLTKIDVVEMKAKIQTYSI